MSRIDTEQAEHPAAFFIGACGGIILLEAGMPGLGAIFIGLFRRVHRLSNEIVEGGRERLEPLTGGFHGLRPLNDGEEERRG